MNNAVKSFDNSSNQLESPTLNYVNDCTKLFSKLYLYTAKFLGKFSKIILSVHLKKPNNVIICDKLLQGYILGMGKSSWRFSR